ncbi:Arylsulfatase [Botrimarina mediterranea]|uniref:Arylsulfatase n=2 Tax=Botrimarina mediterranea TaxID=2528022 RepID=A0A518K4I2_9BACT|nr:Arylsulfatase [Botrimarina mediterranea]
MLFRLHPAMDITLRSLAVVFLIAVASVAASAAEPARPPIVVFLSDDHTLLDSSVYGSTEISTPNMERLAAAGMTFDRAFVASPACAPSRAALLTGLMPARNGAEPNHSRPRKDIKRLPAYFQQLGYEVVSFGKVAHYNQVLEYGFDVAEFFNYHEDKCVAEAVKWLEARDSDKPLCLFVGTNWPHVPWPKESEFKPQDTQVPDWHVETPKTRQARAKYLQAVRRMDNDLGTVYDTALAKLGDDTLFVHTSDHGAQWPFGKWTLYDDGIRTPLIVSWKGRIAEGVRTDAMVSWVDILPTLIEAAGGEAPGDETAQRLDGESFLPVLKGETDTHRDMIFTTHSGDGNFNVYPSRSVRDERYKLIFNLHPEFRFQSHVTLVEKDGGYWRSWVNKAERGDEDAAEKVRRYQERPAVEFYDVEKDPHERTNLADDAEHADRVAAMQAKLEAWMESQGDQRRVYGKPNLLSEPAGQPNLPKRKAANRPAA